VATVDEEDLNLYTDCNESPWLPIAMVYETVCLFDRY